MSMQRMVEMFVKPLRNRVYAMITRAVIETVNDTDGMQIVKLGLLADETRDGVERFQNFGFSSNPPAGAECVATAIGGNRDHLIVIVADDRGSRVKGLAEGESVIYTNDGTKIHLKKGGLVDVIAATKVTVTCPEVEMSGNLTVKGNITVDGTSLQKGAVTMLDKLTVTLTATINGILSALGFSGLSGGAVSSSVNIETTANVTGGGTDLATVKSTFNSHTHDENGTGGGTTDAPNSSV